ncbi:MAG: hypothetical protein Q4F85_11940 [Prevotella sp.]|nr:hypothetical protein [Prevotella sp.]
MLELSWYKIFNPFTKKQRWYVHSEPKETLGIAELAQHMQAHNSPFTAGTIEGLLKDLVKCVREQLLNGNTVKIDDLAIFKLAVDSNAFDTVGAVNDETGRTGVRAEIGVPDDTDETQPAVKAVRLLLTATGKMKSKWLSNEARLGWTTEAQALMDEERRRAAEKSGKKG